MLVLFIRNPKKEKVIIQAPLIHNHQQDHSLGLGVHGLV